MKKIFAYILVGLIAQNCLAQDIVKGNNNFALNMLHQLASSDENMIFSSYSLSTALFMTAAGAREETEKQMLDVLCQEDNSLESNQKFSDILSRVEKKEKAQLYIANSIWIQQGLPIHESYKNLLENVYHSKLGECNFGGQPDLEAKKINDWTEDQTKGKIKEIVNTAILTPHTKLVIINAIYFSADWRKEFSVRETKQAGFHISTNKIIKVDFMNNGYEMNYAEDSDFALLSIPYQLGEASMLIFLPKQTDNFEKSIKELTYDKYMLLNSQFKRRFVNLSIPKFNISSAYEFGKILSEMGMPLAFTQSANFSGISGSKVLKIAYVIHKAFIEISEKGTEASGATAVILGDRSFPNNTEPVIDFKADHPFIFMIKENATGQILFIGVVNNPGKK